MKTYLDMLKFVMENGEEKTDRTGVGTVSVFGYQARFRLSDGFPLLTTKKVHWKWVVEELLWFIRGETNIASLKRRGVGIWDEWITPVHDFGPPQSRRPVLWMRRARFDGEMASRSEISEAISGPAHSPPADAETAGLRVVWLKMLKSCHAHAAAVASGRSGLCRRWLDFAAFVSDARALPNWSYWRNAPESYVLSSVYMGAGVFSPQTALWLHVEEKEFCDHDDEAFVATSPGGNVYTALSHAHGSCLLNLPERTIAAVLSADRDKASLLAENNLSGWKFRPLGRRYEEVLRYARSYGELGPVYGQQWRHWVGADGVVVDQLAEVIRLLRTQPDSRRIVLSAWNVAELPKMALTPCHALVQFGVSSGKLHCHLYQRSADLFLGVPFNIASYSLLTMMLAMVTGLQPGDFVHSFGDLHIYRNHFNQVHEQLSREPRALPRVALRERKEINDFTASDCVLMDYDPHPTISAPVAV